MARKSRPSLPVVGGVFHERYRLVREVARGGMGTVFEAFDERRSVRVAVKVLHPHLTFQSELRTRFARESTVMHDLKHPMVVELFDVGETADGLLFIVMEYLEGETLAARLESQGNFHPEALFFLVRGICEVLAEAHAKGVIHGDLKPANIFLPEDAQPSPIKLLDFGLAKVLGLERLTRTGDASGTPAYMAPELLTGKASLDSRIDTYALGVVIYQCLSGSVPFTARNPGKLCMQVVLGEHEPLHRVATQSLSDALCAVVQRAMSRQREKRFSDAESLMEAYASAL